MATINGRPTKYRITLKELRELMENRGREGVQRIQDFGGVTGIMERLYTSEDKGLSGNKQDIEHRRETFGSNVIPPKPPKTFFQLVCEAVQDITLIILIISALISLVLSLYKPEDEDAGEEGDCYRKMKKNLGKSSTFFNENLIHFPIIYYIFEKSSTLFRTYLILR